VIYLGKVLSEKEIDYLFKLNPDDIDKHLMVELFANTEKSKAKYDPTDSFTLPAKKFYNKTSEVTTIGRFIVNKVLFSEKILENIGYQNHAFDSDFLDDVIFKNLSILLDKNIITTEEYMEFIDKANWLGFSCNTFLVASLTPEIYTLPPKTAKLKEKLIKENEEAFKNNDANAIGKVEKQLIDSAREELKDDPAIEIYDSGCRGNFKNNFKTQVIMRGATLDFSKETKVLSSTKSLVEGIDKEEIPIYANIMTAGSFARGHNTAIGGYLMKQYNSAFQNLQLGDPDSDCGTTKTIKVKITDFNKGKFRYRYIVEDKKLVLLDDDSIKKYIGKTVNMRSPMYCKSNKFCSKCFGELFFIDKIRNIGLIAQKQGSTIQALSMKQFHDATIKTNEFNPEDYISIVD